MAFWIFKMVKGIGTFAKELRENTPASERWFYAIAEARGFKFWNVSGLKGWDDKFNVPLYGMYIPDVHNLRMKWTVEIDGSIHHSASQRAKDRKKDEAYEKWGFDPWRIKVGDVVEANSFFDFLTSRREDLTLPQKVVNRLARFDLIAPGDIKNFNPKNRKPGWLKKEEPKVIGLTKSPEPALAFTKGNLTLF